MLIRKMLREARKEWTLSLSIILLSLLSIVMYCTFEGHILAQNKARAAFHKECNLADLWVYGEGFTTENLEEVKKLGFVKDAQLRMSVTGSAPECDNAQVDIYLENENTINKAYYITGEEFDPSDKEGVWLTNAFAQKRDIKVGDEFTITYNGVTFTRKVKGLIESAEYEYRQAEGDADIYIENIAFIFMSYDAFPIRDYVKHLIEQEKITPQMLAEETSLLDEKMEQLTTLGKTVDDITADMLLDMVDQMKDADLVKMMPYGQMLITTTDGKAMSHEKEIADAINDNYAAMIDQTSVAGIARLNAELEQHHAFSYVFCIVFLGIAFLVIMTSMNRKIENQRTQIGTMNALGMKKSKIIWHYCCFSLIVSAVGSTLGIVVGVYVAVPAMVNMFKGFYIVPGLEVGFDIRYVLIGIAIVFVCVFACYLSCIRLLKIKPAEALRPAPPRSGKRCIWEKLPFWKRLSFQTQYNLRDASRAKLRTFMGIVGSGIGMLLMVFGLSCNGLLEDMIKINFEKLQTASWQMNLSSDAKLSELEELSKQVSGELIMNDVIEISKDNKEGSEVKKKGSITVLEGKGMYNVIDTSKNKITLKEGSEGISRKLAKDLGVEVGDTVYWHLYSKNDWHEMKKLVLSFKVQNLRGLLCLEAILKRWMKPLFLQRYIVMKI